MEHKNLESGLGFKVGLGESLQAGERKGRGGEREEGAHSQAHQQSPAGPKGAFVQRRKRNTFL